MNALLRLSSSKKVKRGVLWVRISQKKNFGNERNQEVSSVDWVLDRKLLWTFSKFGILHRLSVVLGNWRVKTQNWKNKLIWSGTLFSWKQKNSGKSNGRQIFQWKLKRKLKIEYKEQQIDETILLLCYMIRICLPFVPCRPISYQWIFHLHNRQNAFTKLSNGIKNLRLFLSIHTMILFTILHLPCSRTVCRCRCVVSDKVEHFSILIVWYVYMHSIQLGSIPFLSINDNKRKQGGRVES